MKFIREVTPKGLYIPAAALKIGQHEVGDRLDLHVSTDAMVLLKPKMTAMELIRASEYLQKIATDLFAALAAACKPCDDDDDDDECEECCPFKDYGEEGITLPDYLREGAGIPENAKLCAYVDEENKSVIIEAAGYDHDLNDVPPYIVEIFIHSGVCLGDLEEHLIKGDIVYGE